MERIGIELEFQILDENTLDMVDRIESLMVNLKDDPCITHESFQSCIEIKTSPLKNTQTAIREMKKKIEKVTEQLSPLGLRLCSLGGHPFSKKIGRTTNEERYLDFEKEYPYITHHHLIFSTQIHVSMDSLEQSLTVMNRMRILLPVFMALSASCPFWQAEETGFVSFRQYLLKSGLNGGPPPHFANEKEFQNYYETAKISGSITGLKDIHWDVRPRPDLGTLELRVMDAVPRLEEVEALTSLAHCSMHALKNLSLEELLPSIFSTLPPQWAEELNYSQATHLGIEALFIVNHERETISLKELSQKLIDSLQEVASELEEDEALRELKNMLHQELPYQRLHRIYSQTHSFSEVIRQNLL